MAENNFDVIVCGGGPGGSAATAFLSDKGYKVLLLEKVEFPRDKTCGDAISGKSIKFLKRLGLLDKVSKAPNAPINGIVFSSPDGTLVRINVPQKPDGTQEVGYCCRREIFDNLLFENAKSKPGVTVLQKTEVTDLVFSEGGKVAGVKAKGPDGKEQVFTSKLVVGADGANSVVARKAGFFDNDGKHWCVAVRQYYEGVTEVKDAIELHFIDAVLPGYFWIFPVDGNKANVGMGMLVDDFKKRKVNLQKLQNDIIANDPLFKHRFANARPVSAMKGWNLPFGSLRRKVCGNGVLLVGDAAGLIDPFTGEGIGNTLTSASLAAGVADEAIKLADFSEKFLSRYADSLWSELGSELNTSYRMQRLGTVKPLLNFVLKKAAKSESVRQAIAGTFVNEESRKEFTSPLFYLKMLLS